MHSFFVFLSLVIISFVHQLFYFIFSFLKKKHTLNYTKYRLLITLKSYFAQKRRTTNRCATIDSRFSTILAVLVQNNYLFTCLDFFLNYQKTLFMPFFSFFTNNFNSVIIPKSYHLLHKFIKVQQRSGCIIYPNFVQTGFKFFGLNFYFFLLNSIVSLRIPISFYPKRFGKRLYRVPSILVNTPSLIAFQFLKRIQKSELNVEEGVAVNSNSFIELFHQNFDRMSTKSIKRLSRGRKWRSYDLRRFKAI